jgi:chromosome segregation ATPase
METLQILLMAGGVVAGAVAGAAATYWPLRRQVAELRARLERSEQARTGAVERSAQAREQIAQLNRAITDLRRTHAPPPPPKVNSARAEVERALAEGDKKTLMLPQSDAVQAFADTELMAGKI